MTGEIDPQKQLSRALELRDNAAKLERAAVLTALRAVNGNVRQAADLLNTSYRALDLRIRRGNLRDLLPEISHRVGRPAVTEQVKRSCLQCFKKFVPKSRGVASLKQLCCSRVCAARHRWRTEK